MKALWLLLGALLALGCEDGASTDEPTPDASPDVSVVQDAAVDQGEVDVGLRPDALIQDDAALPPPTLTVESPDRGAFVTGTEVEVRGQVSRDGPVRVRVNGEVVPVVNGAFSVQVPAPFGVQSLAVVADRGDGRNPIEDHRDVLVAPRFDEAAPRGLTVPHALSLRVGQRLLDAPGQVALPEAGDVVLSDVASLIEALAALAELDGLLPNPQFVDQPGLSLRVESVSLGAPLVELTVVDEGVEIYLEFNDIRVETSGQILLGNESFSLAGTLTASAVAFTRVALSLTESGITIRLQDTQVALGAVGGEGYPDSVLALLRTLDGELHDTAEALVMQLVDELLLQRLPPLLDGVLANILDLLAFPLEIPGGAGGFPGLSLGLVAHPTALIMAPGQAIFADVDVQVNHPRPVEPPYPSPGAPGLSDATPLHPAAGALAASARLELPNALLHEVWRAGALNFSAQLPPSLAGLLKSARLDAHLPPVVAPGIDHALEAQLGELHLITESAAGVTDVYTLTIRVGLDSALVEGAGGQLGLALVLDEDPEFTAVLLQQGGARPVIPAGALGDLIELAIWPEVKAAIGGSLTFGLTPILLDPTGVALLAPRVTGVALSPTDLEPLTVAAGRLGLSAGIKVALTLAR